MGWEYSQSRRLLIKHYSLVENVFIYFNKFIVITKTARNYLFRTVLGVCKIGKLRNVNISSSTEKNNSSILWYINWYFFPPYVCNILFFSCNSVICWPLLHLFMFTNVKYKISFLYIGSINDVRKEKKKGSKKEKRKKEVLRLLFFSVMQCQVKWKQRHDNSTTV